jgi:hypothetical protein
VIFLRARFDYVKTRSVSFFNGPGKKCDFCPAGTPAGFDEKSLRSVSLRSTRFS